MPPEKTCNIESQRNTHFAMTISGLWTLPIVEWHEYERNWNNTRSIQSTQEYTNAEHNRSSAVASENEAQQSAKKNNSRTKRTHATRWNTMKPQGDQPQTIHKQNFKVNELSNIDTTQLIGAQRPSYIASFGELLVEWSTRQLPNETQHHVVKYVAALKTHC